MISELKKVDIDQEIINNQNLIYFVLKRLGLYEQHEDYFDIGMIGLIKGVKSYDITKGVQLSSYLYSCIKNEILMLLRRKKFDCLSLDDDYNETITYGEIIQDQKVNIYKQIENKILIEKMMKSLNNLKNKERMILNYAFGVNGYEELKQGQIADLLKISQPQVSRIKFRAIQKLKKVMEV